MFSDDQGGDYPYAWGKPEAHALFKQYPEDFIVTETLSFTPAGRGDHLFLYLQKKQLNTLEVVDILASFFGCAAKDIGYAGLKDRQSLSRQWFSINLQLARELSCKNFQHPQLQLLEQCRHVRKLKKGSIASNHFQILLREYQLPDRADPMAYLNQRIGNIRHSGVPNYFGKQRFGIDASNIRRAKQWFEGSLRVKRHNQKSMLLSAARSWLFNQFLSARIRAYGWHELVEGEVMQLDGSRSVFVCPHIDNSIQSRFESGDIHPTLTLWGQGELLSQSQLARFEQDMAGKYATLCRQLEQKGLRQARRSVRVIPEELQIKWQGNTHLQIQFKLPSGCYATSVLREIYR